MYLTPERLAELRELVDTESMSWGDIADLQGAFEQIDPATLPEPAENAGWSDMLDELEARLPYRVKVRRQPIDRDEAWPWEYQVTGPGGFEDYGSMGTMPAALAAGMSTARMAHDVAHHEPTD